MTLKSRSLISLASSSNSNYEFKRKKKGKYSSVDLLTFAEMEPHVLVAQPSRNSTDPIDLEIKIYVSSNKNSGEGSEDSFMDILVPRMIAIVLLAALGVVIIGIIIFFSVRGKKMKPSLPSCCRCCRSCRKKKGDI